MPLTEIQKEILRVISKNRSEESHFAGDLVLNATNESARFSHDFDIFHETAEAVEIDWAADSAFRFFPIEQDSEMGWRLHLFDMATNKALALSARSETRDYIDILELGKIYPLAAIIWAACGKDPGFSPLSLLKMMMRFARIRPETLEEIKAHDLDPIQMKGEWVAMSDEAAEVMERVSNERPDLPIGCAFVDASFKPHWVEDSDDLQIHFGSLRGCWPRF